MGSTAVEQYLTEQGIAHQPIRFVPVEGEERPQPQPPIKLERVYKTLALTGKRSGPVIAVVPLLSRMSYKKLAKLTGNRSVGMVPGDQLVETTGYVHGANNPVGIWRSKPFPIFIDELALEQQQICVSSGEVGCAIKIDAQELANLVDAQFAPLQESTKA